MMDAQRSPALALLRHPGQFALCVLKAFKANQGLLLAGAVAYYTLLSIVPLLILLVLVLAHVVDQGNLLATLGRYLELVAPGQSKAIIEELTSFLDHREVVGPVLFITLVFFSSLAFTVLENSMSVIFLHRVKVRKRRFLISVLIPYLYILFLGLGLLVVTLVSGALQAHGASEITLLGHIETFGAFSSMVLYLVGVCGEILVLTSIYMVMPVGRLHWRHALIGGIAAAVLWEITRHVLLWYFARLSQVKTVYGSLATAIFLLLSLEIAATILLFGAQVIAEYERINREPMDKPPKELATADATPRRARRSR
ncbi:MAG TPA: YihY/virulence factor BrkB family protein [Casimicrobiaceae bacterium]|nr:YihY/virulence factor BrkB family protein [Casimicrobiaceae bacterium]